MALDVEEVVDGRMDGEEPLRGRGRFEPLHLSLSSSHRNLSTTLRHRRFLFTDSFLLLWKWRVG